MGCFRNLECPYCLSVILFLICVNSCSENTYKGWACLAMTLGCAKDRTDVTTADARAGDSTVAGDSRFITRFNVGPRPTVSPKLVTAGDRFIS